MFKKHYIWFLLLLLNWPIFEAGAQDIHFSQFFASPLYLSPSFAGSVDGSRLAANYRDQWPEIPGAFVTYALSYDKFFADMNSGIGLLFTRDQKGKLNYHTSNVGLLYSYDIAVNKYNHFRPGLEFQYSYSGLDVSNMVTRDMIQLNTTTPMVTVEREKSTHFDANLSMVFYNKTVWAGLTVAHLMRPNSDFGSKEKIPIKYSVFSGLRLISKGHLAKPREENLFVALNYMQMANFSQLNSGVMGNKKNVNIGLWYRGMPFLKKNPGSDAIVISLGFENPVFNIGISYDVTISGLRKFSNGATELSISYIFPERDVSKKRQIPLPCPVF